LGFPYENRRKISKLKYEIMIRIEEQITYSALIGNYVSSRKVYIFGILITETKRHE
jgi:hypothetical protein